jgi:hypothetical protein
VAVWQYRIQRIELRPDVDFDAQIETALEDNGMKGWELVQVLHRPSVPEDPICRLIFNRKTPRLSGPRKAAFWPLRTGRSTTKSYTMIATTFDVDSTLSQLVKSQPPETADTGVALPPRPSATSIE